MSAAWPYTRIPREISQAGKLLTSIPEAPDSNVGHDTDYPEGFRGISQFIYANAGIVHHIMPLPFPSKSFPIHYSLTILPFDTV
jgi:hypothetical protein